jgi:NADH-quinone oxidoreductase subunit A
MSEFAPIFLYFLAVLGFAGFSLLAPHVVAPRKRTLVKEMPYESGMDPIGDARKPLDIRFYLIAILFLIFDIELLLVVPYAVALKGEDGIPVDFRPLVLGVMLLLVGTLVVAYMVAWRKGVFQWRKRQSRETL